MIRFLPDTWRDALLRPLAMASPDTNVYVEIPAPDIRFAVIALLLVAVLATTPRTARRTPLRVMLVWVAAAFAVWLATSGNGRYFMPVLLAAGPICIGLICRLPVTRSFKACAALLVLGGQAFVLHENPPWDWWGLATWGQPPFFQMTMDREAATVPATYVTATTISYSLLAPRFPADSRWINITSLPDALTPSAEVQRAQTILAASKSIKLLIPTRPKYMTPDLMPDQELRASINDLLHSQKLALREPLDCRMLPSRGLASEALHPPEKYSAEVVGKFGFWICSLQYPVKLEPVDARPPADVQNTFAMIEQRCPRYFEPGQTNAARLANGWLRSYPQADIKVYVFDDGDVYYKYMRALNSVLLGHKDELLRGEFRIDCHVIRGRAGLPWEREI